MRSIDLDTSPAVGDAGAYPVATMQLTDLLQYARTEGPAPTEEQAAAVAQSVRSLLEMQDRERQTIALEIHDGFEQLLTAAIMHFDTAQALCQGDPATQANLERGLRLLAMSMHRARRVANQLQPPSLDDLGVTAAVADLVREAQAGGMADIELIENGGLGGLPPQLRSAVFRIVQEGLANACRHSRSERVRIELCRDADRLRIEIRDWGIGFDPQCLPQGSFGVESMRARALAFGGQMTIDSRLEAGSRVVVELPVPEGQREL